jgi:hypothetical protein
MVCAPHGALDPNTKLAVAKVVSYELSPSAAPGAVAQSADAAAAPVAESAIEFI